MTKRMRKKGPSRRRFLLGAAAAPAAIVPAVALPERKHFPRRVTDWTELDGEPPVNWVGPQGQFELDQLADVYGDETWKPATWSRFPIEGRNAAGWWTVDLARKHPRIR